MAVQGNDTTHLRDAMKKALAEKNARNGGVRISIEIPTIEFDMSLDIKPGRLTFKQRNRIRKDTGQSLEAWVGELDAGQTGDSVTLSPETIAALIYVAMMQNATRVTMEEALAVADRLDEATVLDLVQLGPDGQPFEDDADIPDDDPDDEPVRRPGDVVMDVNDPEVSAPA